MSTIVLKSLKFILTINTPMKIISLIVTFVGISYCWFSILSIAGTMQLEKANGFMAAFLFSYLGDLFVIEIILIAIKIIIFPEVEKRVNQKESNIIFNLIYFFIIPGSVGMRNGFF